MTVEYGYRGSLDVGAGRVPAVNSSGEPIFAVAGGRWASELVSSDEKYRFLKAGYAQGRGAGNVFDAALADNFTVLMLARTSYGNSFPTMIYKGSTVAGVAGWRLRSRPVSSNGSGAYWSDSASNQEMLFPDNGKKTKDRQWHWWSAAVSGATASLGLDGNFVARARTATDLSNTSNLVIGQTGEHVAVVLFYSRLLTDAEVASICAGTTRPTDVSGCIGYYKFNETHGSSSGSECTDYSGQGNHLTYSGAGWEVFDPSLTTGVNFGNGQPYVAPQAIDAAQWWNKQPFAIATPEAQGMVLNGGVSVPYNALMNLTGDLSYGGWVYPQRNRTTGIVVVLTAAYGTANGPCSINLSAPKQINVTIGDTSTGLSSSFYLSKAIPLGKWLHIFVTLSGTSLSLYLNGMFVQTLTNAQAHGNPGLGWSVFDTSQGAVTGGRSIRVFSRAITASEVLELFYTDQIANRAGLVAEWLMNTPHSTTVTDTSGNAVHGSAMMVKTIGSPYQVARLKRTGKQLKLANGNFASFSSAALRSLIVGSSVLTVSAWVKMTRGQLSANPIFGLWTSVGNALAFLSNGSSGYIYAFARESEVDGSAESLASTLKWQEFTGRYVLVSMDVDYYNDILNLYINGKLQARGYVTFSGATYSDAGNPSIRFAANSSELHVLDACRIWNRALTAQEHYNLFRDVAPRAGLVAEYLFDDDTTSCLDSSGNGFHATWGGGLSISNYVQEL